MSRSKWKFNYLAQDFISQEREISNNYDNQELILQSRSTYISEEMLGFTVRVYNGMKFFTLTIGKDKLGYRIGEFAPTKKKAAKKKKIKKKKK